MTTFLYTILLMACYFTTMFMIGITLIGLFYPFYIKGKFIYLFISPLTATLVLYLVFEWIPQIYDKTILAII